MSGDYESEQTAIRERITELQITLNETRSQLANAERFLNTIKKYTDVQSLDKAILNELIDKIEVHTGEGKRDKRRQLIEIHWRFVGTTDSVICQKNAPEFPAKS